MKKLLSTILVLVMVLTFVTPMTAAAAQTENAPQPIPGISGNAGAPDLVVDPDAVFDPTDVLFDTTYGFPSRLGYRTLTEVFAEVNYLALEYPHLIKKHVIGHSAEGLPIVALEVSNNPGSNDGRPGTVHQSVNHGGELPAIEMSMNTLWYVVTQYGTNAEITELLDTTACWFIPTTNPDGVSYSQRIASHRKTRGPNGDGTFGVDMNRNWPYGWGSSVGSSTQTSSTTYRGPYPMSSPEIQAMVGFYENNQIITSVSGHTSGQMIIYAWGHRFNEDFPTFHPDKPYNDNNNRAILQELGREMAAYNMYADKWSESLYPATGELCDYAWGAARALHFTIEYGTAQAPAYMGADQFRGIASFNDAYGKPLNFLVTYATNSAVAKAGAPATDLTAKVAYVDDPALFTPGYGGAHRQMTVEKVTALGANLAGKIFVTPRGADNDTNRDIILAAQSQGAVGVIFFGAGAVYYATDHGHYTPSFGTSGTSLDITIPVAGTSIAYGRELYEQSKADANVTVMLTSTRQNSASIYEVFERNIGTFMHAMNAARDYASYIKGAITDGKGNLVSAATLSLESHIDYMQQTAGASGTTSPERTSVPLPVGTLTSTHKSTYNVDGGNYSWAVVPSKQPENHEYVIPDAPYFITATANGRYSEIKDVMVDWYKKTIDNVNFDLPVAIASDFTFNPSWDVRSDITVPFSVYASNGQPIANLGSAFDTVRALVNGQDVQVTNLGGGNYSTTFNLKALGITSVANATLEINFFSEMENRKHSPLVIGAAVNQDGLTLTSDKNAVEAGESFVVNAAFGSAVNANTGILTYTFDKNAFVCDGFTPAADVTVLEEVIDNNNGTVKITVMKPDYAITSFGDLAFHAKDTEGFSEVVVTASYVVKAEDGSKLITSATASKAIKLIPVYEPGDFTLIDLSDIIDAYGTYNDEWDFTGDGYVGLDDVTFVALRII